MRRAVRLLTLADLDEDGSGDGLSVSARHEAVLEDGRRVLLLDDRGWTQLALIAEPPGAPDVSPFSSEEDIAKTARAVVGPDAPFGGYTRAEMEAGRVERGLPAELSLYLPQRWQQVS